MNFYCLIDCSIIVLSNVWFGLYSKLITLEPQKLSATFSISYAFIDQFSVVSFAIQLTFIQSFPCTFVGFNVRVVYESLVKIL